MQKCIIYARVSSDRQEKEGFSIPAQIDFLTNYAAKQGLIVDKIFQESETAKKAGRKAFNEMLLYIKREGIKIILVEKTDRLYRNFKDYVLLDEYDLEIHLAKEGTIISKNSKSHDKFIHGIKVLMAKNYIDNLSEEVKKGLTEKVKQGQYPCKPPLGYKNGKSESGKNIILVNEEKAPYIEKIFKMYAEGYSLEQIRKRLTEEGLRNDKNQPYAKSRFGEIIHNIFYIGKFVYKEVVYDGIHKPIISLELYNRVQMMSEQIKPKKKTLEFDYTGLIKCGECGCQLTAEIKKGKYIYYHCTGNRGGSCKKHYIRQEEIEEALINVIKDISKAMPKDVVEDIKHAIKEMQKIKCDYENNSEEQILKQINILKKRIDGLYADKLDGKITEEFWHEKNVEWHAQKNNLVNKLQILNNSSKNFYEGSNLLLNFCNELPARFSTSSADKKRQIIKMICSNLCYKDGKLSIELKSAFEYIIKSTLSCKMGPAGLHWNKFLNELKSRMTSDFIEELRLIA